MHQVETNKNSAFLIFYSFDGQNFAEHSKANYQRSYSAFVSYHDQPVIIGGYGSDGSEKTSETFESGIWYKVDNIPIPGTRFDHHSALVLGGHIYTFGGYDGSISNPVRYSFVYDSVEWSKENGLAKPKYEHRSILIGQDIYHVGGHTGKLTEKGLIEKWSKVNGRFIKESADFQYTSFYLYYPEVFAVNEAFCNSKI